MLRFENRDQKENFWLATGFATTCTVIALVAVACGGTGIAVIFGIAGTPAQMYSMYGGYKARRHASRLKKAADEEEVVALAPMALVIPEDDVDIDAGTVKVRPKKRVK